MKLDETLTLLAEHAPKLRAAGVRTFSVDAKGTVTAELVPHEAAAPRGVTTAGDNETETDPLNDADTFGGKLPGFDRPSDDDTLR